MQTREQNECAPIACNLRDSIAQNSDTLCADCVHVLDSCKSIRRETRKNCAGFIVVISCDGFEGVVDGLN